MVYVPANVHKQGARDETVHIYVNFPGNTAEALAHYEKVFGTKVAMKMTFGETPWANAPDGAKSKIMHA